MARLWSHYYGRVVHDEPDHGWHTVDPAATPPAQRGLGLTMAFPGGQQFIAVPGWSDAFHRWHRFASAARDTRTPARRDQGHQIFIPVDITA